MEDPKRRVLDYLDADRVRLSKHFDRRCRERLISRVDARRILRNGSHDEQRSEGDNLAFVGADSRGKRLCVIVRIDEAADRLILVSVFPIAKGPR